MPPVLAIRFDPYLGKDEQTIPASLSDELNALIDHLEREKEATIEGIGTLTRQESGMRFMPFRDNFYAFNPIPERLNVLPAGPPLVDGEADIPETTPSETSVPELTDTKPAASSDSPDQQTDMEDPDESRGSGVWVKWAAFVALAIVAVYGYYWYNGKTTKPEPVQTASTDSLHQSTRTPTDNSATTSKLTPQDSTKRAGLKAYSDQGDYKIIIASFRKLEEAKAYVGAMEDKGFQLRIIAPNRAGNLHKVSYGGYKTREDALTELRRVRKDLVAGAWLYVDTGN